MPNKIQIFRLVFAVSILLLNSNSITFSQNRTLKVEIEGIHYDSLFIYDLREIADRTKIRGTETSTDIWTFQIPDSVYHKLPQFVILPRTFNFETSLSSNIRFVSQLNNNDTCFTDLLNFEGQETYIKAKYKSTFTIDSIRGTIQLPNKQFKNHVWMKVKIDILEAYCDSTSDIHVRMIDPFFSMFLDLKDQYDYEGFINHYIDLAQKYPDSRYLLINLAEYLDSYKSINDVEKIYGALSSKYKNTIWGKTIQRYLSGRFENTELKLPGNEGFEPIIQDSTKYNLIVFSASWCRPCHELIPLLKDIYNKSKGKMEITYISLDEKETIPNWKVLMEKEKIPWRSLLADEKLDCVRKAYYVRAIPHAILVMPSMSKVIIDVRKDEDKLLEMIK